MGRVERYQGEGKSGGKESKKNGREEEREGWKGRGPPMVGLHPCSKF